MLLKLPRVVLRAAASVVALMFCAGLTSGCAGLQGYEFVDDKGKVSGTFTCLGVSDEQWKSVLKPGRYLADVNYCEIGPANQSPLGVGFVVWGVDDPVEPSGVFATWALPIDVSHVTPLMFYRFAKSVGTGGAFWAGDNGAIPPSPAYDAAPSVVLELYHAVQNDQVVSRGLFAKCSGTQGLWSTDWQPYTFLKGDVVADLVQLAFWGAQGLKAQYPDLFPNPLPAENPSPYVPPADGSLPTSTYTGTPIPPIYITPSAPTPSGESTP